jgi:hypothetical protein
LKPFRNSFKVLLMSLRHLRLRLTPPSAQPRPYSIILPRCLMTLALTKEPLMPLTFV